jgi:signal recognition particle receptor subunit alpha
VGKKLEGSTKPTFQGVASLVRAALEESLTQILTPRRQVNILRDVQEAQRAGRPYVITFCGVNGMSSLCGPGRIGAR